MIEPMEYRDRACDLCGSRDLERIWTYQFNATTRSGQYVWQVCNVICRNCGFAFVSPSPTDASLARYYADCHAPWSGQSVDYSVTKRLEVILRHLPPRTTPQFVEIGGSMNTEFASALRGRVRDHINVELNTSCNSECRRLEEIPADSADIVAAYFVLEHVANPTSFLALCRRCLKEGGFLIIEVPDLYLYPSNPAGLDWWEHTSHFSPRSLGLLAQGVGLRLLDLSYKYCSRSFGFVAVLVKDQPMAPKSAPVDTTEYLLAKACMEEGMARVEDYRMRLRETRQKILDSARGGYIVVLWAANNVCKTLLEGFSLPDSVFLVDSNPDKKHFLAPLRVYQPSEVKQVLRECELLVINTHLHADRILETLEDLSGRAFDRDRVIITDPGW